MNAPIDAADFAILETYSEVMNRDELRLLEECRRLRDVECQAKELASRVDELEADFDNSRHDASNLSEEIDDLERKLSALQVEEREARNSAECAVRELAEFRERVRMAVES